MSFLGQSSKLIIPKKETNGEDFVALNSMWEYRLRRRNRFRWSKNGLFLSSFDQYLVAAYKFSTGAVLADSKGNNDLDEEYSDYETSTSGKSGACVKLYAPGYGTGLYVQSPDFSPTQSMAVSWWIFLFDNYSTEVFVSGCETYMAAHYVTYSRFELFQSDDTKVYLDFNVTNYIDSWHHCVFLANGSEFRAYIDGSLVGSTSYNGTIKTSYNNLFYIGTEPEWTNSINGKIDEVYFWKDISINTSDMDSFASALYNNGEGAFWI